LEKIGEWKNDKMVEYGIIIDKDGNKYEGELKNDEKSGKGVETYINGDVYKGEFK
jgi:hypothetical protein